MRYFRFILFSFSILFNGLALASVEVAVSGVEGDEYANVMALLQIARLDKDKVTPTIESGIYIDKHLPTLKSTPPIWILSG